MTLIVTRKPGGGAAGGAGVSDHGALTGLADDDHPQYTTAAELAAYAQPVDSDLTAIAALSTTSFGRSLLAAADAAALRTLAGTDAVYQPLDSDLTSIAALTTTAAGRGVLTKSAGTTPTTLNEVVALLQTWGISA